MFVLTLAVPAFLVVLVGYLVGHGLWTWMSGLVDAAAGTSLAAGAEPAGWSTGALLLAGVLVAARSRRRRQRRRRAGAPARDRFPQG